MLVWMYQGLIALSLGVALICAVPAIAGKGVNLVSLSTIGILELGLLVQLVTTFVVGGANPGVIEIIGYEIAAMLVLLGAVALTTIEKTKRASLVLAVAPLVICVMLVRMWTIWTA